MGVKGADLAAHQPLPSGGPAALAGAHELLEHVRQQARVDCRAGGVAAAQQPGQGADGGADGWIGHQLARRRGVNAAACLADEQRRHRRGMLRVAGRQIEYDPALFWRGRGRQAVEHAVLRRTTQRWVAFERSEGGAGQVGTARRAAGAAGVERHAGTLFLRFERCGPRHATVIDLAGDDIAAQPNLDRADQHQAAAARQGARIEYPAEVFGGETRGHQGDDPRWRKRSAGQHNPSRQNVRALMRARHAPGYDNPRPAPDPQAKW